MTAPTIDITITRGKTFEYAFLYADDTRVYKPITAMPGVAPVRLTVASHGVPDGWPVEVESVRQPSELNTQGEPRFARAIDADTLEFNALNGSAWKAFSASGTLVYHAPVDLTGWTARAVARDKIGGAELLRWSSAPQVGEQTIEIDTAASAFVLKVTAGVSAALEWTKGVWELEATDPSGNVFQIVGISKITVAPEVVT